MTLENLEHEVNRLILLNAQLIERALSLKKKCDIAEASYDIQKVQLDDAYAKITDLKQQLHAYKQYHDAQDAWQSAPFGMREKEGERMFKANEALQLLRNSKG